MVVMDDGIVLFQVQYRCTHLHIHYVYLGNLMLHVGRTVCLLTLLSLHIKPFIINTIKIVFKINDLKT